MRSLRSVSALRCTALGAQGGASPARRVLAPAIARHIVLLGRRSRTTDPALSRARCARTVKRRTLGRLQCARADGWVRSASFRMRFDGSL